MRGLLPALALISLLTTGSLLAADSGTPVDEQTKSRVRSEIERYITADVKLKKYFFIADPRSDRTLRLLFDHVHDGVSSSPRGYGACVDFKDSAGKLYDVDFLVSLERDAARVNAIVLHKADGKAVTQSKESGK